MHHYDDNEPDTDDSSSAASATDCDEVSVGFFLLGTNDTEDLDEEKV